MGSAVPNWRTSGSVPWRPAPGVPWAALVPRPRLHLIRFHGVLAPHAKLRSQVVPAPAQQSTAGEGDCQHALSAPLRMTWARLLKRVCDMDIEQCACGGKIKSNIY